MTARPCSATSDQVPGRPTPWFGLYVHVPFCGRKCPYCGFYSLAAPSSRTIRNYLRVLEREISLASQDLAQDLVPVTSLFFGGGTPTLLDTDSLIRILDRLEACFPWDSEPEITIEANPGTIQEGDLRQLRQAGFNRLSLGVQSLADPELAALGRIHTVAQAREGLQAARRAGFANIGLDLIYGLPGQTVAAWQQNLEQALALDPDHLALYELTIEEATPFARLWRQGVLKQPDEEEILTMMAISDQLCRQAGLHRYEISNWARPGYECQHNLNYWHNGPYLGFGPGAASHRQGHRWTNAPDLAAYTAALQENEPPPRQEERLDRETGFRETVIVGLRMVQGVDRSALRRRFGLDPVDYYGQTLEELVRQDLIALQANRLRLTAKGLRLANQVMLRLV